MFKKIILILPITVFLSLPHFTYAGLVINEIMYDLKTGSDEGREWVEVYNDTSTSVDLSLFKFFEADTNHKLKLIQGDANIEAQGYAVIIDDPIKFKIDWPNFCCTIFDSSFSLSNSGETLAIKNGDQIIDEFTYQSSFGADADGKSLQKINGVWLEATPTPGIKNRVSYTPPPLPKSSGIPAKTSESNSDENKKLIETESTQNTTNEVNEETIPAKNSFSLLIVIFIIFLGVAGGAIYFIRRKGIMPKSGDDFEILDD